MKNDIKKKLIKVKLGEEGRYIEEGDTLDDFKENFKKEFKINSNINDYTFSCKDKVNRITKVEDEQTYQKIKTFILKYPKLIEPSFVLKEKAIHKNSKCSECGMSPIIGIKYHCMNCDLYELCSNCEIKYGEKHGHPLLKLRKAEYLERFKNVIFKKEQ